MNRSQAQETVLMPTSTDRLVGESTFDSKKLFERPSKIRADGLRMVFGSGRSAVHALGPLSVDLAEGEFVSIVGPSGCGKSTFVKLVGGLLRPTSGEMHIQFRSDALAPVATVFQDFGIFPWKTVLANVELGLRSRGVGRRDARTRATDWLRRMGLEDFKDAYPDTLSGGMRQRVAIARALASEPDILLMDEPFAALDAQMREILQEELLTLSEATSATTLFVTHSLEEALVLGDRVIVMTARPGIVLEAIDVPFERPRDVRVRESPEFNELRGRLWEHLRREVRAQFGEREKETSDE